MAKMIHNGFKSIIFRGQHCMPLKVNNTVLATSIADPGPEAKPMTEQEWLTSDSPRAMIEYLGANASERKLRQWVNACRGSPLQTTDLQVAIDYWTRVASPHIESMPFAERAELLREVFGNPWRPIYLSRVIETKSAEDVPGRENYIFGELEVVESELLAWQRGAIPALARHIHDTEDWSALTVLHDMLVDAGCTEAAILQHLCNQEPCPWCPKCKEHPWFDGSYNPAGMEKHFVGAPFWDGSRGCCEQCWTVFMSNCPHCNGTGFRPVKHCKGCWALSLFMEDDL